jgi:C-terminal processing protease CtpA/Prc
MAFGGPAYNSGILKKGDRIVRVDGNAVITAEEIENALVNNDFPGATVALTIERANSADAVQQLEAVLTKIDVSLIADRCQVFHAFALLKVCCCTFCTLSSTDDQLAYRGI